MTDEPTGESPSGVFTIVFTDVEGSTDLSTRRGDEAAQRLIELQRRVIREQVERHGGRVADTIGDGFMLVFASTRKAVSCAVEIQRALAERARRDPDELVKVRIGLNVGEVLERDGHPFGAAVNAAARVAANARGGEILVAEAVRQLAGTMPGIVFRDRGRFALKGFPERWRLYQVAWDETARALAERGRRGVSRRLFAVSAAVSAAIVAIVIGSVLAFGGDGSDERRGSGAAGSPPPGRVSDRAIFDSDEILPGRSIGEVRLGMREDEVVDWYGEPELVRDWKVPGKVGSVANYTLHDGLFYVYYYDGKVVGIATRSDYYATADGLRAGGRVPFPNDERVTRSNGDFVWRAYVYEDRGLGCNFWSLSGFGAVTELVFTGNSDRIAGIRIADEELAEDMPRGLGRCR